MQLNPHNAKKTPFHESAYGNVAPVKTGTLAHGLFSCFR